MKIRGLHVLILAVARVTATPDSADLTSVLARVGAERIAGFQYSGTKAKSSVEGKTNGTLLYSENTTVPQVTPAYILYYRRLEKDALSRNGIFSQFKSMKATRAWLAATFVKPKVMDFTSSQNARIRRNENVRPFGALSPSVVCHQFFASSKSWLIYHDRVEKSEAQTLRPVLTKAGLLKKDTLALCHSPPGEQQYFVSDSYVVGEKSPRKLLWVCHLNDSAAFQDVPLENRVFCHSVQTAVFNPYVNLGLLQ